MARVLKTNKSNRLTEQIPEPEVSGLLPVVSVSDAYYNFLRVRKSICAESTYKIYKEIGDRVIIPQLTDLTGDNMNATDADILRLMLDNYSIEHEGTGGTEFLFRHLKAFINWYWDEYEIPVRNPISKVRIKTVAQPPKEGITQDEIDKLLNAAKRHSNFPERDIAFLMILCDTGIRRSSIANLKMKDVDVQRSEMLVFEKDQKYHIKAFGSATCKAIKKYLLCLSNIEPEDPFWLQMDGRALAKDGLREILRRCCNQAGIPMHHFHDFRRYYGKTLYETTHDIYMVSRALDHKDVHVTKRYIAIDDREAAEAVRIYSPMDRRANQTGVTVAR